MRCKDIGILYLCTVLFIWALFIPYTLLSLLHSSLLSLCFFLSFMLCLKCFIVGEQI